MKVYDLKDCPQMITDIFYDELEVIQNSDLLLKENYTADRLKLDNMLSFDVLIDDDMDLVCFGGLQKISQDVARVSSRHYVSQKYKKFWHNEKRFRPNWQHLVPKQIQHAYDLGYKGLFWSAHIYRKKWMFELTCRNAEEFTDIKFTPLPGLYNIYGVGQRVCQIGEYDLGFANENVFIEDDYFYQYKDELYTLLNNPPANVDVGGWLDHNSGIIDVVELESHPILNYLGKYFDDIKKVMVGKTKGGIIPPHQDQSERNDNMHMKIRVDGDWSSFYVQDKTYGWKTHFPNTANIAIFDNEKNVHGVDKGEFLVLIPYGKLKREIYERVDTESR